MVEGITVYLIHTGELSAIPAETNPTTAAGDNGEIIGTANAAPTRFLRSTTTNTNGEYMFDNLRAADYQVVFDLDTIPDRHRIAEQHVGDDTTIDSDAQTATGETPTLSVQAGTNHNDIDIGIRPPTRRSPRPNPLEATPPPDEVLGIVDADPDPLPTTLALTGTEPRFLAIVSLLSIGVGFSLVGVGWRRRRNEREDTGEFR